MTFLDDVQQIGESGGMLNALLDHTQMGMALLDADGVYLRVNDSLCRLLGRSQADMLGHHEHEFTHPDDRPADQSARQDVLDGHADSFQTEKRFLRLDGEEVWTLANLTFLREQPSGQVRWVGQFQDVTRLHESREELRRQSELLASVIDNAPIGKALVAPDGTFLRVNRSLCRIVGYSEEELLALTFQAITVPEDLDADLEYVRQLLADEITDYQMEKRYRHKHGYDVWVRLSVSLVRDHAGEPVHFISQLEDITKQKQAERELRRATDHAETILTAMGEGYALTIDGQLVAVNDRLCEITGFTREQLVGAMPPYPFWRIDRIGESMAIRDRVIGAGGGTFEITLMRADGTHFDGEITAQPATNPDGTVLGFVNTIRDITARKRAEAEQHALREIAELVASNAGPGPVFTVVAREVQQVFGAHSALVTRFNRVQGTGEILSSHTADGHSVEGSSFALNGATASAIVYRTGRAARVTAAPHDHLMGDYFVTEGITGAVAAPIAGTGQIWGTLVAAFNRQPIPADAEERLSRFGSLITLAIANAQAWATLERDARTDSLTGLVNHRAFSELLQKELDDAARNQSELSLILFDIDRFKAVNDSHGHQVGDAVLAEVGRLLNKHARDSDVTARIGGEEFAWLMPRTNELNAVRIAERLRRVISEHDFGAAGQLTISAGIGAYTGPMSPSELLRRADRALYQAKNTGRNAVRAYSDTSFLTGEISAQ